VECEAVQSVSEPLTAMILRLPAVTHASQASPAGVRIRYLDTPPVPYLCEDAARVFDAFAWCASRDLEWRYPEGRWDPSTALDGTNPQRMVFVFYGERRASSISMPSMPLLPREPAFVHAPGLGLTQSDQALAPWAIDEATDGLFATHIEPREVFWLAADNSNALFWGLHDWAHFHNHGPFAPGMRAWTELQCDGAALVWLLLAAAPDAEVTHERWERLRAEAVAVSRERFAGEGLSFDEGVLAADRLQAIAARARRS
jgi:hypothetical protein